MEAQIEISQENVIRRINELHTEASELSKSSKNYADEAIQRAFECGRLLTEQKKIVGHGKWKEFCDANIKFAHATISRYMGLYRKLSLPEENLDSNEKPNFSYVRNLTNADSSTLRKAYIATGILPEPEKSESKENSTAVVVHVKYIDNFITWYRKANSYKPARNWNPIEIVSLIQLLEPITQIYNELVDIHENS